MIEVEVQNVQSIERAKIQIDGFTALVGRSNIGKSAMLRAVKAALTGAPVDAFVRHGPTCARRLKDVQKCKCFVSVHIKAEDFDLLWEKGDAINRYVFNGQTYDKPGQGVPDFLQPAFSLVKVGDEKRLLQVADQFSPIFLLDESGTAVADVISDVAKLDDINAAMREVERDRREAVSTRKVRDKDVLKLQDDLAAYDGLDDAVARYEAVARDVQQAEGLSQTVTTLDGYITAVISVGADVEALEKLAAVTVPGIAPVQEAAAECATLSRLAVQHSACAQVVEALTGVDEVPVPDGTRLTGSLKASTDLVTWVEKLRAFRDWFNLHDEAAKATVPDVEPIREALGALQTLFSWTKQYEGLAASIVKLEAEEAAVATAESTILIEVSELGVCPTCTRPVHLGAHP